MAARAGFPGGWRRAWSHAARHHQPSPGNAGCVCVWGGGGWVAWGKGKGHVRKEGKARRGPIVCIRLGRASWWRPLASQNILDASSSQVLHATVVEVLLFMTPSFRDQMVCALARSLNVQVARFRARNPTFSVRCRELGVRQMARLPAGAGRRSMAPMRATLPFGGICRDIALWAPAPTLVWQGHAAALRRKLPILANRRVGSPSWHIPWGV